MLSAGTSGRGPIIAWMSRDQRAKDNWMLAEAQRLAIDRKVPVVAAFGIVPHYLGATLRQYDFMLRGLEETRDVIRRLNIPLRMLADGPGEGVAALADELDASMVVSDFDPLRPKRRWKAELAARSKVPLIEVDAHNTVPCWLASDKQEYAARTLRPKLRRLLPSFLDDLPELEEHPYTTDIESDHPMDLLDRLDLDRSVRPVEVPPGTEAGTARAREFIALGLERYPDARNDPSLDGQSRLSPYLHFGQVSAQRVALEVQESDAPEDAKAAFLEELVVRKELSDNYCYHNQDYDSFSGLPEWAQRTLNEHREDEREHLYTEQEMESAETADAAWNAAQREMVRTGRMHGYMRMYWAKKILEWTPSPEEAMRIAVRLNDRYELDGRDPNGYVGIAWSIGGLHDRAWRERPIYGKVRYMSYAGLTRKFDLLLYLRANA